MDVELVRGDRARALLADAAFLDAWQRLLARCPYATAFQGPRFVGAWYQVYADWEPVLALARGAGGELAGLWLLAYETATHCLTHAGGEQAEYQAWLAVPDAQVAFLGAAWRTLKAQVHFSTLTQKYLPAADLAGILAQVPGMAGCVIVHRHRRPLLKLEAADLKASFAKKSNKSRFNRLKRLGAVQFRRVTDPAELDRILDELVAYYDFRHGAVHDSLLFRNDPQRREFHRAMFAALGSEVYVTVTYLNETPVAAFWGAASGTAVHLGMIVHSPALAEHSPGKLHIMQLSELLLAQGKDLLDLTPGDDPWKERFASDHDEVADVVLYRAAWRRCAAASWQRLKDLAKPPAARLGLTGEGVRELASRARRARIGSVLANLPQLVCRQREFRVYRLGRALAGARQCDSRILKNSLTDLVAFEPAESWQTRRRFLSEALARLERGESVYTVRIGGRLAHSGWLSRGEPRSELTEVGQTLELPPGAVLLSNFFTDPAFRGQGLYRATLGHMLQAAFEDQATPYAYIGVLADNAASRHVIEAAGFEYQRSYFQRRCLGRERRWVDPPLPAPAPDPVPAPSSQQ